MSEFTTRIDSLLIKSDKKRADLVRGLGVTESTVRSWYSRNSIPSAELAYKVAQYFGVTVEYLVTGKGGSVEAAPLVLDDNENELIDIYRSLDNRGRSTLLGLAHSLENVK